MADGILNPIEQLEADFDFDVYTKQEVDALLDEKADKSDTYTKTETDALLDEKADADAVYTKTETDTLLSAKADKSTTLAGYGITDAYTKTQTDNLLNGKADADSVYTKTEINTKIPNTVGSATKPTYVNGGVITECTYELNKTVPANAVFTDTTYSAGNGLNLSGTSFSAKAGVNVSVDGNGINVNGNGAVASADSGLVSGGTAYTELRPTLDGTWVKNAQTTAINLQKLEGGIEYLYAILSKQYDQLKKYINGNYYDYDTDANSKYTKTVPQGAMPYASLDSVGGKTLVWNQLVNPANIGASKEQNGITFTNNGDGSITVSGTATGGNAGLSILSPRTWADHKFCLRGCPAGGSSSTYCLRLLGQGNNYFDTGDGLIWYHATARYKQCDIVVYEGTVISTPITFRPTFVDLTLMYGAGNEPSTVAEFESQFPAQYYSYNAGTLLSAGVTEVVSKGKNLFPNTMPSNKINATVGSDGTVSSATNARTFAIPCMPNTDYMLSQKATPSGWGRVGFFNKIPTIGDVIDAKGSMANRLTFSINSGNNTYLICTFSTETDFNLAVTTNEAQIEVGTTKTTYSPYVGTIDTYTIPADIQSITGYGWSAGSVYNYVDFERKVFVKRVGSVDLGSLSWAYSYNRFSADVPNMNTSTTTRLDGLTCIYPIDTNSYIDENMSDKTCKRYAGKVLIKDSAYTTTSAFTSAMSGVMLYYELATPIETDISAYLTDDNLISVEAGGTLTFPNQHGDDYRIDVPSSETYMVDLQEAI